MADNIYGLYKKIAKRDPKAIDEIKTLEEAKEIIKMLVSSAHGIKIDNSLYHMDFDKMFELGEAFLQLKADKPQIFYIWGHSYEFDFENSWDKFEEFCRMMSGHDDIFYGTNREIFGIEP